MILLSFNIFAIKKSLFIQKIVIKLDTLILILLLKL